MKCGADIAHIYREKIYLQYMQYIIKKEDKIHCGVHVLAEYLSWEYEIPFALHAMVNKII
jgi:hypothetical protein